MRKILALLLFFMIACTATQPVIQEETETMQEELQSEISTHEEIERPAQEFPPTQAEPAKTPEEETESIEPYTELGCEQMITTMDFATSCSKNPDDSIVTFKVGTNNCFVTVKDRQNERLTAGMTLNAFADGVTAMKEFERRLQVLKVGADDSVGEKAYVLQQVGREKLFFIRDEFLVEMSADAKLCSTEGVLALAKLVDAKLD